MQTDLQKGKPLVSIITTSFNSSKTIGDTLQSVADQDYPFIEHLIIDGASTDNTLELVKKFTHIKLLISESDKGIYDAMNKGLKLAKGDIIGLLNSDDFYADGHVISEIVMRMQSSQCDALYGDLVYVHPERTDRVLRTWVAGEYRPKNFLYGWMPPHPTFYVRKEIYDKYGCFNIRLRSAADYELMLRFLYKEKISVSYLPRVLVNMRTGGVSNSSIRNRIRANKEDMEAWRVNNLKPYFFTAWLKPLRKLSQFIRKPNPIT